MKKIGYIALLFLYLPAAIGVGFNLHYCGGSFKSVEIYSITKSDCCCGDDEPMGCCTDDYEFVKIDDNSQETPSPLNFTVNSKISNLFVQSLFSVLVTNIDCHSAFEKRKIDSGPPLLANQPIFIQIRSLLI